MSDEYEHFLLTFGYDHITDNNSIMLKYKEITCKEYETLDETMIQIIRDGDYNQYKIYHVKKSLLKYVILDTRPGSELLSFDYNKYKIDCIKRILSSEIDSEESILAIEKLTFSKMENPILSDYEYLSITRF